ncbi:MAG TPA: hypothetical protein VHO03_10365 [Ignavibacteriales bacterium]|nr:hypothetical protein [Ignavibacteriales bacterium]
MKVMAEKTGQYWISSGGKVAVTNEAFGPSIYGAPHTFTMVNPLTLEPVSQTRYTDEIMGYYSVNTNMAVSETGLCIYSGLRFDGSYTIRGPGVMVLLNLNPFSLVKKDSAMPAYGFAQEEMSKLTDEGEYILNAGLQMMNLKNGKFVWMYLTDLQNATSGNAFLPSGKEFIEINPGGIVYVRRCSDYSLVRSFPIESVIYGGGLDPVTGYLGVQTGNSRFRIYDTMTGRVIKEIPVANGSHLYFTNSTLFSSNGYYIKLNYN